jgi:hypothetical protein
MGSKNAKSKGRDLTTTKVKNRGNKIVQQVRFNAAKANELFAEYQKNGLKYGFNQVMSEMQFYCKDRFCDLEENGIPYSLNQFRAAVGRLMGSTNG